MSFLQLRNDCSSCGVPSGILGGVTVLDKGQIRGEDEDVSLASRGKAEFKLLVLVHTSQLDYLLVIVGHRQ